MIFPYWFWKVKNKKRLGGREVRGEREGGREVRRKEGREGGQ
jgi:hypothetical protein